jgi:putative SOS response-associated peptidase YedK
MCFHTKLTKSAQELEHRFKATFKYKDAYIPSIYNGFQFPRTPVICNQKPEEIRLFQWGLIPSWAKDDSIKKNTLNARIETINEKPAFRNIANNRCLILSDGFYEWKWLDPKGKVKQKYLLTLPQDEAFAFAGIWSEWVDKSSGEIIHSYSILTTEAKGLMSEIHNSKNRMPVILDKENEKEWLHGDDLHMQNHRILATAI